MLRLLIVDDEVIVRKWLTLVFQPFDKEFVVVDAAANGHEALEICRIHAIDIVITDIIMPDMDGMSFIQALREFNLHTQVIILSNHADFSLAQKGMSFGAAAYLLKGEITEEELLEATRRAGKKLAADDNPPSPSFLGISSHQVSELLTGGTGEVLQAFDRALISEKDTVWCIVFSQDVTPAVSSSLGMTNGAEWTNQLTALLAAAELSGTVGMITDHIAAAVLHCLPGFLFLLVSMVPPVIPRSWNTLFLMPAMRLTIVFFGGPGRSAGTGQLRANTRISGKK